MLPTIDSQEQGFRLFVIAAALVIIIDGISQAQSVLVSLLVAIFFAMLGTPPVCWLTKKGVPSTLAVLAVVSVMIAVLVGIGGIVGASISSFYSELPAYQVRLQQQIAELRSFLANRGIRGMDKILIEVINPEAIMSLTARLFTGLGSALSDMFVILLTVTFILFEAAGFPDKLRVALGDPTQVFPQFTRFVDYIERYMILKTIISFATGLLVWAWLSLIGVDFPVLWGFLAFLLNYVPNVGSAVAAIPAILFALIQTGTKEALLAAFGIMAVNFILGNVVETMIMGQKLGLSPLIVFLSLIFWGGLLGPVGMVLCIPLSMTLKFACENSPDTLWIAVLLGPQDLSMTDKNLPQGQMLEKEKLS
ncbi:MAG: AI-2E family transporter [Candidatus Riflebacteria bacterium]|nr:AI-2E family transporter [Candidatus Riflebacteria bacterium]